MDPHTTQKKARTCKECHQDPRALGLGEGNLFIRRNGTWGFRPALSSAPSGGISHPLDAFVGLAGRPLVHTSRPNLRPFNRNEITRILYVGLCLNCHKDFSDPVMRNWTPLHAPPVCEKGKIFLQGLER
ncbi:hypothetical protein [Dissulfurimicrobium hydrothermale]|uniref:hypothetical protein n=1 Tax=Dissulfurimicrobium hydrothermale TaxID=1750598 RepID=UPI001EDBF4F4|nr:hypothetical protein [Dissulfurimicrobium hydrothermale]UKL14221.1 hypothetical protein LGS26_02935 [Dissulfurimicrobium hydrothermale]